jgi:transaldolase/glucose-6-phosphate isomerase
VHSDFRLSFADSTQDAYWAALARLQELNAIARLWARDATLWPNTPGTRALVDSGLGWLDAPTEALLHSDAIAQARAAVIADGITHVVLVGMGGSSLAPEVIARVLAVPGTKPSLRMLDSVAPAAIRRTFRDIKHALVIVASKSGTTLESTVLASEARRQLEKAGVQPWSHRFVAITDPGTPLASRAEAEGFRNTWLNGPDIGGRYSALSLFGLVPAALSGTSVGPLLQAGIAMSEDCRHTDPANNPGAILGAFLAACAGTGRVVLTIVLPECLAPFGLWLEQLVAESTGKDGVGILPVVNEPARASYRLDRAAVVVDLPNAPANPETVARLRLSGAPVAHIRLTESAALGGEFFRWEYATALCALLMGVNPFDQPDVQGAKIATSSLLARYASAVTLPPPPGSVTTEGGLVARSSALTTTGPLAEALASQDARYLAVLAFGDPGNSQLVSVLDRLQTRLAARTSAPVTLGYGPRYLHSTGQLHKGGFAGGRYLLIAHQPVRDLDIPAEPHSFGILQLAQARADFAALDRAGRHAVLLEANGDTATLESALDAHIT